MESGKEIFSRAVIDGFEEKYREGLAVSASESGEFSRTHARRMSSIIGSKVKYVADKHTRIKRAVAAALIAAALLLAGCAAIVYKEQIGDFFVEIHDTYIKGDFIKDENANNQIIEEYYTLTYVPEGYELVEEYSDAFGAQSVWKNDKEKSIIFEQNPINSVKYTIDGENGFTDTYILGEKTVYCRIIDETYCYIWNNEKYAFSLYSDTEINEEEIIQIIDGISMKSK